MQDLITYFEESTGRKLNLKINDNRSTMININWSTEVIKASVHRMFLSAPDTIQNDLKKYLIEPEAPVPPSITQYIDQMLPTYDYSERIKEDSIRFIGRCFNLQSIYEEINQQYFNGSLLLKITWFGRDNYRPKRQVDLGLFFDHMKLIKIHRILDDPKVPKEVIKFIIYHEMLHAVYPVEMDSKGRRIVHSKAFNEKEAQFESFDFVTRWIEIFQNNSFELPYQDSVA